ncbi:MAG: MOSC domain-containing protein [Chloroflexi bacterium]|nr:MOSC domain-containing protein [Chloroflexota bacterium]
MPGAADPLERPWRTGYYKSPVAGPVWLGLTNLRGDGQADRKNHGGRDKAVLGYAASHYPDWRAELEMPELAYGAFGENFTITFLDEGNVCLGDVYALGAARLEVSQPRQPCQNITRRWRRPGLMERVRDSGRHGWYLRVLVEGEVEAGQPFELLERPCPEWSIARVFKAMRRRSQDRQEAARLARVAALSESWRQTLGKS